MNFRHIVLSWLGAALLVPGLAGCEDKDYDHVPADGMGSVYLDNRTGDDINVYIDGVTVHDLDDYDERAYDVAPGLHRVVLDEQGGDRYGAWDVDIVAGRLTVLEIRISSWDWEEYDADLHLESP